MENLELILSIAGGALGLLVTAVTFIIKFIKAIKARNIEEAKNILRTAAEEAVQFVEAVKSTSASDLPGKTKLTMALTRVNQTLINAGVKYDEKEATAAIEELVALTKAVNKRDKDKIAKPPAA